MSYSGKKGSSTNMFIGIAIGFAICKFDLINKAIGLIKNVSVGSNSVSNNENKS